jgi:hypothetical protein
MVRSRVYGILAGYEGQNDHGTLRHDPVFKLLAGRSPEADDLASQPTLSRFENAVSIPSLKNAVLQRQTEGLLAEAVAGYERERQAAARQEEAPRPPVLSRLFTGFWYQAGTWPRPRWVVAKAEANDKGTNRRFVVTNRPGAVVLPGPTYDEYAGRGESENRNREFKCDLAMDRLSDHRFVANYFRLYLHALAMNLLVRLRRFIAEPLPALAPPGETAQETSQVGEEVPSAAATCVPAEALTGAERQRQFRLRRQGDPLGEGHPRTWRALLIKVAAEVLVRTRRIVVRLSSIGHTWTGIAACASACVPPSRSPIPIRLVDPLDKPSRCRPRWG